MRPIEVRCPQCGERAAYRADNPFRPFCGERCKLIDLGAWAEERYAIAGAPLLDAEGELAGTGSLSAEAGKTPQ
jgi:uncharacterized protein